MSSKKQSMSQKFAMLLERIRKMMSRSTKAQNWSYSKVVDAADMGDTSARASEISTARTEWEATATANGLKVKKDTIPVDSLSPMWRDDSGNWTDVNPGTDAQGYKITISGPTG